jgi:hypothetical protein
MKTGPRRRSDGAVRLRRAKDTAFAVIRRERRKTTIGKFAVMGSVSHT